jgi:hypothetical protein
MRLRAIVCVLLILMPMAVRAEWHMIRGFESVQAKQEGDLWCWAAVLQMVAAAQRVTLSQDQIVAANGRKTPGASYDDITGFLQAGWRGRVGETTSWTVDADVFRRAPPAQMLARFFDIGRPVILAYRTSGSSAHAVIAIGGDVVPAAPAFDKDGLVISSLTDQIRMIRIYDPADGTTSDEEWAGFARTIIGAWSPIIMKRDGCNVFGPGVVLPAGCSPPVRGGVF